MTGEISGKRIAFLARHGIGHKTSPTEVNYRANIFALKTLGTRNIISVSACGSLKEEFKPGDIVVPDQLFDHTNNRSRSFFEIGIVAHIGVGEPFCERLNLETFKALQNVRSNNVHFGGKLITIEGPRFSTRTESNTYRSWGMSIIGMTTSPEAYLAREAEICYAVMAHVTDYDVWHVSEEPVTVEMVIEILNRNTMIAQEAVHNLVRHLNPERLCDCEQTLASALITDPDVIPPETLQRLGILVDKYLK